MKDNVNLARFHDADPFANDFRSFLGGYLGQQGAFLG
jgi:hypothetical protein